MDGALTGSPPDSPDHAPSEVDPRISLANERTFLAWIRTALGIMAAGVLAAEVFPSTNRVVGPRLIGAALILFGAVLGMLSYRRWRANERRFASGRPMEGSRLPGLLTSVVTLVAALAMILALWVRR